MLTFALEKWKAWSMSLKSSQNYTKQILAGVNAMKIMCCLKIEEEKECFTLICMNIKVSFAVGRGTWLVCRILVHTYLS